MSADYEYTVRVLTNRLGKDGPRKMVEELNELAEKGWRLVTVMEHVAFFERRVQS